MTGGPWPPWEPPGAAPSGDPTGPLDDLLRLHSDIAARIAEDTARFVRSLGSWTGPAAPGSIVVADGTAQVEAEATVGTAIRLLVRVRNAQATAIVLAPTLSPFDGSGGERWFPAATGSYLVVPPGTTAEGTVGMDVPVDLPAGDYRGELFPRGVGDGMSVVLHVRAPT